MVFSWLGTVGVVKSHVVPEACEEEEDEDQSIQKGPLLSVGWELSVLGVFSCKCTQVRGHSWEWEAGRRVLTGAQCQDDYQVPSPRCAICRNNLRPDGVPNHTPTEKEKKSINNEKIIFKLDCSAFQIVEQWPEFKIP